MKVLEKLRDKLNKNAELSGQEKKTNKIINKFSENKGKSKKADQKNADGLFWNYFLHTERMYGLSPLFDGCYILVKAEE